MTEVAIACVKERVQTDRCVTLLHVAPSAGRVLATVFWDLSWGLLSDFLEHMRRVNFDRYYTTLKTCKRPSGETVRLCLATVWFSSMMIPNHTWHIRLGTCCKIQLVNIGPSLMQSGNDMQQYLSVCCHEGKVVRTLFHPQWRCQETGTNLPHTLWQVCSPSLLQPFTVREFHGI
jgi:hypothetical protein